VCLLRGTDWVSEQNNSTSILRDCPRVIYGGRSATLTGFSPSPAVSPVSIIPPMLHTHLHLHVALTRGTNGRSLETFQKAMFLQIRISSVVSASAFTSVCQAALPADGYAITLN